MAPRIKAMPAPVSTGDSIESASVLPMGGSDDDFSRRLGLLEKYCLERKRDQLKRGVREILAEYPDDSSLRERCIEWLWRAGLQREGIKVALPRGDISAGDITPEKLGRLRSLWLMLLLIGQNGWPYAAQWLGYFDEVESLTESWILAGVLNELGNYDRAWSLLDQKSNDSELQVWVIRAFIAWRGERFLDGLKVCARVQEMLPKEDRITRWWITALQAYFEGEANTQYSAAVQRFVAADTSFPSAPQVAPRFYAMSRIWLGTLQAKMKDFKGAAETFERGALWYQRHLPDFVPLRIVDLYHWKTRVMEPSSSELSILLEYPGPPPHIRRYRSQLRKSLGSSSAAEWKRDPPVSPVWVIASKSDEYWVKGTPYLGVPLEIRLLAILRRAGALGVHRNLVKALLWPHELKLYFQLDGRFAKLVERLRVQHGLDIISDRDCYSLAEADRVKVQVLTDSTQPSFLADRSGSRFSWEDVAKYYQLGATQARAALKEWLDQKRITKLGSGRLTRYQVISDEG
jgi:hypothetical protein